ncbi:hypothetical protein F5X97DRAFT_314130 [Nemania serpens]|nr:hypothetical protein F5X97DRAFT_314130 [Nemania serpens]
MTFISSVYRNLLSFLLIPSNRAGAMHVSVDLSASGARAFRGMVINYGPFLFFSLGWEAHKDMAMTVFLGGSFFPPLGLPGFSSSWSRFLDLIV